MTDVRVTQVGVEEWEKNASSAAVTQVGVEQWDNGGTTNVAVTFLGVEEWRSTDSRLGDVVVSFIGVECWHPVQHNVTLSISPLALTVSAKPLAFSGNVVMAIQPLQLAVGLNLNVATGLLMSIATAAYTVTLNPIITGFLMSIRRLRYTINFLDIRLRVRMLGETMRRHTEVINTKGSRRRY